MKSPKRGRRPPQQRPRTKPAKPRQAKPPAAGEPAPASPVEPLRPRPWLFYILLAVVAIWIAFLLVMYLTTVRT